MRRSTRDDSVANHDPLQHPGLEETMLDTPLAKNLTSANVNSWRFRSVPRGRLSLENNGVDPLASESERQREAHRAGANDRD
jgi:hypothetical protein